MIACIAVLFSLLAPALAATKTQSAATGCLSNLRQMMTGWEMYREEYNDYLMPNAPLGAVGARGWINGNMGESWFGGPNTGNTNVMAYITNSMAHYLKSNLSALHCPGDVVSSADGPRIRSYSMNGAVGTIYDAPSIRSFSGYSGWRLYAKGGDILRPSPAGLFVFTDESPATINDGFFQEDLNGGSFPDLPADYLEGACGFSFADGHGEIHRWLTSVLLVPVQFGRTQTQPIQVSTAQDPDWSWLRSHTSSSN
jgi:hypothetical protein